MVQALFDVHDVLRLLHDADFHLSFESLESIHADQRGGFWRKVFKNSFYWFGQGFGGFGKKLLKLFHQLGRFRAKVFYELSVEVFVIILRKKSV